MSVFNVNQMDPMASNAVERNASGDRLNENVPDSGVAVVPLSISANRNSGINNNNSVSAGIGSGTGGGGVSVVVGVGGGGGGGGFGSDLCSDSEEDFERTARKLAVKQWLKNYDDVSTCV